MKQLQLLSQSIVMGIFMGGVWAVSEYLSSFRVAPAWEAAGVATAITYWVCNRDDP